MPQSVEQRKVWYAANKDRLAEYNREYQAANRNKIAERKRVARDVDREATRSKWRDDYWANKAKRKKLWDAWYVKNRESVLAYNNQKRAGNLEYFRAQNRLYERNHKGRSRFKEERRRSRKAGLPATLTNEEWDAILLAHSHQCAYCGIKPATGERVLEQDHVIPVTAGGGYTADNIVPACKSCNSAKGNR